MMATHLTDFVMGGDTSESVRTRLQETEAALGQAKMDLDALTATKPGPEVRVPRQWIETKLARVREQLNQRADKIPEIRVELRKLIADRIALTPTAEGQKRHYVATVKGNLIALVADAPGVTLVNSPTGIRTPV